MHPWHNSHSINISDCRVWGASPEVQVSSGKFHTHIHLDLARVEFLSYIKKEIYIYIYIYTLKLG